MPKKSAIDLGTEVHQKIDESLRDYGEAFIRIVDDEVEIVHPDKVTVMTDDENRKVICVGKDVDTHVFAVLSNKESTLADLLKPRPYQESVMRALMDPEIDEISLRQPRRPSYLHEYGLFGAERPEMILPLKDARIPHLKPGEKLKMTPIKTELTVNIGDYHLEMEVDDQMSPIIAEVRTMIADHAERVILANIANREQEDKATRHSRKIIRLLMSSDRRKKRRGHRLFRIWMKNRPGYNFHRYNKD